MVAGAGDALNTQDNVRRDDAENNDLSHVHNLTRSRLGRLPMGRATIDARQIDPVTAHLGFSRLVDTEVRARTGTQDARDIRGMILFGRPSPEYWQRR
jgi:hypothetical protein